MDVLIRNVLNSAIGCDSYNTQGCNDDALKGWMLRKFCNKKDGSYIHCHSSQPTRISKEPYAKQEEVENLKQELQDIKVDMKVSLMHITEHSLSEYMYVT